MNVTACARRLLARTEDFYPQLVRALEKHRGKGLWVHFTDVPKVGIKTNPAHKDPVGVYFFPLDHIADSFDRYHHWAFRKYMFVCRVDASRILDLSSVTAEEADSAIDKIGIAPPESRKGTPGQWLWSTLDEAARSGGEWGAKRGMAFRRLLLRLGYDAVRDPGLGIIHPNEPDQLLALDPGDIEVVEMVETTTRPYDADAYYRDPKYPFRGRSTKPAVEMLKALAGKLGLSAVRVKSHGKGSWGLISEDPDGNRVGLWLEMHTSGSADYVSFRAKFSADWHSGGRQIYEKGEGPGGHGYEFSVRSDYGEVVAPFAEQVKSKMEESPPDDTSYVESPLRAIAEAMGGARVSVSSPVRGTLAKRIGPSELRLSLGFEHPDTSWSAKEPSYSVSGAVALPRSPVGEMSINPSFGQEIEPIPAARVVDDVLGSLPGWIEGVLDRHFPEGDARYDHIRRYTLPVVEFLSAPRGALTASRYHSIHKVFTPHIRGRGR